MVDTPDREDRRGYMREYMRDRRRASLTVYFSDESEKARFEGIATAQGYARFSAWVVQMLYNASSGSLHPAEYVAGLEREVAKYRSWLEQKDQEIVELRRDLRVCEAQREDLRVVLAALNQDVSKAGRKLPTEG